MISEGIYQKNNSFNFCRQLLNFCFADLLWRSFKNHPQNCLHNNPPLVLNLWFMCFRCVTICFFRSGVILNWWTVKITIRFNRTRHRTFRCRNGSKGSNFLWIVIKTWYYVGDFKFGWIIRKILWRLRWSTGFYWRIIWVNIDKWKWSGNTADDWICCTVLHRGRRL